MGGGDRLVGHTVARFPEQRAQMMHMFRNAPGHIADTPANRQLLLNTANNARNFVDIDRFGSRVYTQMLANGNQVWVYVRNGVIQDGGVNLVGAVRPWIEGFGLEILR